MKFEEFVKELEAKGLDIRQSTRIESTSGDRLIDYNPASDIVNLFPTLLGVSINDLNSITTDSREIELFAKTIIDQLCQEAYNQIDGFDFENILLTKLKQLKKSYPDLYVKLTSKFFVNALLSYFVANKFGLRACPEKVGGQGYFQYFALLDIFDDLEEDTQNKIIEDMAHKNLWAVTDEDI